MSLISTYDKEELLNVINSVEDTLLLNKRSILSSELGFERITADYYKGIIDGLTVGLSFHNNILYTKNFYLKDSTIPHRDNNLPQFLEYHLAGELQGNVNNLYWYLNGVNTRSKEFRHLPIHIQNEHIEESDIPTFLRFNTDVIDHFICLLTQYYNNNEFTESRFLVNKINEISLSTIMNLIPRLSKIKDLDHFHLNNYLSKDEIILIEMYVV